MPWRVFANSNDIIIALSDEGEIEIEIEIEIKRGREIERLCVSGGQR